jgi:hypothetical protein
MSGKGYALLERYRKDQRRGYVLLLSSLLYFLAILLDRPLLIPQWKYHQSPASNLSDLKPSTMRNWQSLNYQGGKANPSPVSSPGSIRLYNYAAHPFPDGFYCHVKGDSNNRDDGQLRCTEKEIGKSEYTSTTATAKQPRMARLASIIDDALGLGSGSKQQHIDLMKIDVQGFEQAVMEIECQWTSSSSSWHRI